MTKNGKARMSDGASIDWQMDGLNDSPIVVLSNSLGTTRSMWDSQIASLSSRFRVLRYDTRGHGHSDVTPGSYGLDRLGRDAVELLDALEIKLAHFCGVSLGGMTGQWLGVHAADRIDRMVLANTASYMGPPSAWQGRIDTVLAGTSGNMAAIADAVIERWFTSSYINANPEVICVMRSSLLACAAPGYAGCCAAIRDMDLRPVIQLITCPTLIISGLQDSATPPEQGAMIADAIPGSRSIELDAAHLSNIEQPVGFNEALLDFFD